MNSQITSSDQELIQTLEALLAGKRWSEAVSIATAALAGQPENQRLQELLADARHGAGRPTDTAKAEAMVTSLRALQIERQERSDLEVLASQELARGRLADAEMSANELVRVAPGWAESYNTRGRVLIKMRKLDQAESDFRTALRLAPDEPTYMNNLGLALHRRGKRKEAIEWFRMAATKDPSFAAPRRNLYASTGLYLWGGGLLLVLSLAIHAAGVGITGGSNARVTVLVAIGLIAILVPAFLARYWWRKRSMDPAARKIYELEARRAWRRPDQRTVVRAAGFLVLAAAFAASMITNHLELAGLSAVLAILWLHRGWTVWRYATGWFHRS